MFLWPIALAALLIGIFFLYSHLTRDATPPITADPDTSVPDTHPDWETYMSASSTFKYPKDLGLTYVHATDWPPAVVMSSEEFSCTEAGVENESGGITVGTWLTPDQPACVTVRSEGAAGSTYRLYAYAIPQAEGQIIFTWGARFPQCMNYDDPQQSACKAEQESFDPDALIYAIYKTYKQVGD